MAGGRYVNFKSRKIFGTYDSTRQIPVEHGLLSVCCDSWRQPNGTKAGCCAGKEQPRLTLMLSCVFLRTQVDLDHRFIDHGGINLLDLSDQDKTPTMVINEEQTNGADWLLLNDTDSAVCNSFPTPYDNDYRGER